MHVGGAHSTIFRFQITCLEIKESLGGLEQWGPALTAGDTRVLCVAQGTGRETPHLSLRSPYHWVGCGRPLWVSVSHSLGSGICVNKTFAIKRDESHVYKSGRISFAQYIVLKHVKHMEELKECSG